MATKKRSTLSKTDLENLAPTTVDEPLARSITSIYAGTKDIAVRRLCLCLLYDRPFAFLEDFFDGAFRKERYLDMRILALRGLASFREEQGLVGLLAKVNDTLRKRAISTPYNYQEYECLLGQNALPYLVRRYGYPCLRETLAIVQSSYDAMPDDFKGRFTIDENGKAVVLR